MLSLLAFTLASATTRAPWDYTLSAELPQGPATMPLYTVLASAPVSTGDLQDVFGITGTPEWVEFAGGVEIVTEGDAHLYNFDRGGSAFHDLGLAPGERRIRVVSDDTLWQTSESLLEDLGLLDLDVVGLQPDRTGGCTLERHDGQGALVDRYSCGQAVAWQQTLEGWPTFGPGSDVAVHFGDAGVVIGFESTVRSVVAGAEMELIPPRAALARALFEGSRTGRWNTLRSDTRGLVSVDIDSVELGYFVPDRNGSPDVLVPVYAIHAIAALDGSNGSTDAEILWYEPAVRGVALPDLAIPARN